ncbi:hypothetical protein Tsubulata_028572, partial [Turnera subulata]
QVLPLLRSRQKPNEKPEATVSSRHTILAHIPPPTTTHTMAVVFGNLALLLDVTSPRIVSHRKTRPPVPIDVILSLYKRDPYCSSTAYYHTSSSGIVSDGEDARKQRVVAARGKANSETNGVDFDSDDGEEDDGFDWEAASKLEEEMRRRAKEREATRELEAEAVELQRKAEEASRKSEGTEETEEEKRMRVRKELEKVAQERAERRATAQKMFDLGQKAYGRGMYSRSVEFLEGALTIISRSTLFGGEIQIWLGMAYEANGRHEDCIDLFKLLKTHPSFSIRRQAADLLYIYQAPKIKISKEEMLTFPPFDSGYAYYWDPDKKRSGSNQLPSTRDYLADFLVWRPPVGLEKNKGLWVALTL